MMTGFGLDPAGYCEGRSVLAVVERRGPDASVTILKKLLHERWASVRNYKRDASCRDRICDALGINPASEIRTHDDLDAVICALTAAASHDEIWTKPDYEERGVALQELPRGYRLLSGYRLLKRNPFRRICVSEEDFCKWMGSREKHV